MARRKIRKGETEPIGRCPTHVPTMTKQLVEEDLDACLAAERRACVETARAATCAFVAAHCSWKIAALGFHMPASADCRVTVPAAKSTYAVAISGAGDDEAIFSIRC